MASLKSCTIPVLIVVGVIALMMMNSGNNSMSEGFTPIEMFDDSNKENFGAPGDDDTTLDDTSSGVVLKTDGPSKDDYDFIKQCATTNKHLRSHMTVQNSGTSCLDPPPMNSSFARIDGDIIQSALLDCDGNPPKCLAGRTAKYS
jgi:hypothetical protein